jgi:hypothetical protein
LLDKQDRQLCEGMSADCARTIKPEFSENPSVNSAVRHS